MTPLVSPTQRHWLIRHGLDLLAGATARAARPPGAAELLAEAERVFLERFWDAVADEPPGPLGIQHQTLQAAQ